MAGNQIPHIKAIDQLDGYSHIATALYRIAETLQTIEGHMKVLTATAKEIQKQGMRR